MLNILCFFDAQYI